MVGGRLAPIIPRTALLDSARHQRVVLLEAPGGYGKSTFASQLISEWELGTIRLQFAERTGLAQCVAMLRRAVRRAGFGDLSDAMTSDEARDPLDSIDLFVGFLAQAKNAVTLVFDDVQRLDPEAANELARIVSDLPNECRAIVVGRDLQPFLSLGNDPSTEHFGTSDFRMGLDEIRLLLHDIGHEILVGEIFEATTGWPAAIGLAIRKILADPLWSPLVGNAGRTLLDELVVEIVRTEPRIAQLAFLPLVDATVADLVGGPDLLTSALSAGVLSGHLSEWYVVPDPIRESLGAATPLALEQRIAIAQHYQSRSELRFAITMFENLPAENRALAALLVAVPWGHLEMLEPSELVSLLTRFDDETLESCCELLVHACFAVELLAPQYRTEWLARALSIADAHDLAKVRRAVQAEQSRDLASTAQLHEAVAVANAVLLDAPETEIVTRARAMTSIARVEGFWCTAESLATGARLYAEASELFRQAGEHRWRAETLARRGYTTLFMAGFPQEGEAEMRAALGLLPTGDYTRGFWLANYADVLDFLGRSSEALGAATEALEIGNRRHDRTVISMAWWSFSWIAAHRGDREEFRLAVEGFERNAGPWIRAGQEVEFLCSTAELSARLGDLDAYERFIVRARPLAESVDYLPPVELAEATYQAMWGDPQVGIKQLEALYPGVALVPSNRPTMVILQSYAHARAGNLDRAAQYYRDAQDTAAIMDVPDLLSRYMKSVLDPLVAILSDTAEVPSLVDATTRIRMFGSFAVEVAGSDRTPQAGHPCALVKLLALHDAMSTDSVIDTLWPEAEIETGRRRLRNLLNRIRQRSGDIVTREGEMLRLGSSVITDLSVFESRTAVALSGPREERVGTARLAIALYAGELLPGDMYEDWAAGPRERAKRQFLSLLDLVADDAVARGDSDEAVRLLDQAIAVEPLDESRYARLCEVLVQQGRVGSAREVAKRAVLMLEEIGEVVSEEIEALITA